MAEPAQIFKSLVGQRHEFAFDEQGTCWARCKRDYHKPGRGLVSLMGPWIEATPQLAHDLRTGPHTDTLKRARLPKPMVPQDDF